MRKAFHKADSYVNFKPTLLKKISGAEKLVLFRDLYETKGVFDAITVYDSLVKSGLDNQLNYHDYHCMFHLLLTNPQRHQTTLLDLMERIRANKQHPSEKLLNSFLLCTVKWNDEPKANQIFDEILKNGLHVNDECWVQLLQMSAKSKDSNSWKRGIEIWEIFKKTRIMPTRKIYFAIFALYSKTGQLTASQELFEYALGDINRLKARRDKISADTDLNFKADCNCRFFNAQLSCLVENQRLIEADQFIAQHFEGLVVPIAKKNLSSSPAKDTFSIMLKLADCKNDFDGAAELMMKMKAWGIEPGYAVYLSLISICGSSQLPAKAQEWFDLAILRLNIQAGTNKHQALIETLTVAFAESKSFGDSLELFRSITGKRPRIITYTRLLQLFEGRDGIEVIKDRFASDYQ